MSNRSIFDNSKLRDVLVSPTIYQDVTERGRAMLKVFERSGEAKTLLENKDIRGYVPYLGSPLVWGAGSFLFLWEFLSDGNTIGSLVTIAIFATSMALFVRALLPLFGRRIDSPRFPTAECARVLERHDASLKDTAVLEFADGRRVELPFRGSNRPVIAQGDIGVFYIAEYSFMNQGHHTAILDAVPASVEFRDGFQEVLNRGLRDENASES